MRSLNGQKPGALEVRMFDAQARALGPGRHLPAGERRGRLSEHTVHRHIADIFHKLGVSSRAAAVAQAARRHLLG
jgi:hypothetical protein